MAQVVTGSRLRDGVVVFLGPGRDWVETLDRAQRLDDKTAAADALARGCAAEAANVVVDVYAIDVVERDGRPHPIKLREAIRAQGPTVHPAFGKSVPIRPATTPHREDDHVSL